MAQATHTHKWPTHQPQCNTLWCMPWCPSTMPLTHTPKEEDHGLMAKVASTTCHHYERERDWMVDSGLVSVDKPLATQQGKRRHHSSHAAITQAYTNNHHTITLTTQAWSWSLTACSLTHTRGPRQDKEHTTTKPMVWMACTVTMVWHKRGCGVVLPSSLVQHVVAPTPSKWPRAHHTALQPPQHPCFLVSTHVPQPVHTHPHVCVCVTVALSHPPCPQVWSSTTVCPASPPPGPSSTTNHHHQQQQHKSKRVW